MPTILCIDDNESGLAMRKLMLKTLGYSVFIAEDGPTGLALLRTQDVDAIILDSRMLGMPGEAVADTIRKERPKTPIIVLTGFPEIPPGLVALADAVVTKGEPPQVLLAALERLTGRKPEKPAVKTLRAVQEARRLREQAKAIRSERRKLLFEHQRRLDPT